MVGRFLKHGSHLLGRSFLAHTSRFCLALLLLSQGSWAPAVEVTPKSPVPRDSLVTVRHGGYCWVIGIINGQFAPVRTHECQGQLVFVGPPGSYLVYGVEKVDEQQRQFQEIVQIVGSGPDPGPGPGPDPTPDPDDRLPDGLENAYGIGGPAYLQALRVGTAADLEALATAYGNAARYLHELRLTPVRAMEQLREVRQKMAGDWTHWEKAVEDATQKAVEKYGGGILAYRDYCREIGGALSFAAKKKKSNQGAAAVPSPTRASAVTVPRAAPVIYTQQVWRMVQPMVLRRPPAT